MDKILSPFRQGKTLNTIFLSNILISFHYALIIYINSAYLANFFSETQISSLYIIGAIINTLLLLNISKILEKVGSYKMLCVTLTIECLSTTGMVISHNPAIIGLAFLLHSIAISIVYFNMDIFVESASTDESKTGSIRATYLTLANLTIVLAPALVAILLSGNKYILVYIVSAMFLLPLYFLIGNLKKIESRPMQHIRVKETIYAYLKNKNLFNIFASSFLLQFFYAFMVIYVPLYLEKYIGFSWSEIGLMFTIMLLPFILFELPLGELEDSKYTEREFLTIGFVVMGLSTMFISFLSTPSFWIWTIVLFATRVGASFVEISTESYFFKRVDQEKTDVISFFRITRPLSFLVAPLLATLALQFISFQFIFMIVGALMILGTHNSMSLTNKKI